MRYTSDEQRRYAFRDWLRAELARLDFYQRRGDRYLVSEFARYATQKGARVEEVSLGRYLRDDNPVLPTPESCRELARALERHPAEVLMQAGYLTPDDFFYLPGVTAGPAELERQREAINGYTYLPEAIRTQMQASLDRQMQLMQLPTQGFADDGGDRGDNGARPKRQPGKRGASAGDHPGADHHPAAQRAAHAPRYGQPTCRSAQRRPREQRADPLQRRVGADYHASNIPWRQRHPGVRSCERTPGLFRPRAGASARLARQPPPQDYSARKASASRL